MEEPNEKRIPQFLCEMLEQQYGSAVAEQILHGYSTKRRVTLRANTLKASWEKVQECLEQAGIRYEHPAWCKEAFILADVKEAAVRSMEIFEEGGIYMQSLSSMLPPLILQPRQGADILDMAAAPGGKTTQMAALTANKAHITACEMNAIRAERLKYNVQKQGASGVYIMQKDARTLDDFFSFDQILLDAPCSGSGTLDVQDANLDKTFTRKLIGKSTAAQTALLKKAVTLLKKGQELVYSTCSVLSCENEDIVRKVTTDGKVSVVPIAFDGMDEIPVLPVTLPGTLCVAPTELYEGFFVAKLRKNA
jgi:16S rRNA C967 or C1407 C5-methylase (RsmB/RsmF family)